MFLLLWLADSLLGRVLPLRILVIRRHPAAFLEVVALGNPAGYDVRVATRDELLRAAAAEPTALSAEFVEAALRKGDTCVAVFDAERIVSFSWCAQTPTRAFDDVWISVGDRCLYGYKAATFPRHRGQGLHALCINYAGKHLAAPRGKDTVAVIHAYNGKALASQTRVSRPRLDLAVLWLARKRLLVWMTASCRAMGLGFSKGAPAS
jgi:hypothetical protein